MDRTLLDGVTRAVLASVSDTGPAHPDQVTLLLREFIVTGGVAARLAAESGLATGLVAIGTERDPWRRLEWLRTLDEAAACVDDGRMVEQVRGALPDAIDTMETAVRRAYEPGEGLVGGGCGEQLRAASALLAAFGLTGRVPYAMLAEELLQHGRRRWWDASQGRFAGDSTVNCVAARVLCRLAALEADPDYTSRAVVAPERQYRDDARRILEGIGGTCPGDAVCAAAYGVALLDWFALESILQ